MASKFEYSGGWFRAGFMFGFSSILMLILASQQVEFYYLEETELYSVDEVTRSEWCSEDRGPMDSGHCNQWKFDAHISVIGFLFSTGLCMMCLAQARYIESLEDDLQPPL